MVKNSNPEQQASEDPIRRSTRIRGEAKSIQKNTDVTDVLDTSVTIYKRKREVSEERDKDQVNLDNGITNGHQHSKKVKSTQINVYHDTNQETQETSVIIQDTAPRTTIIVKKKRGRPPKTTNSELSINIIPTKGKRLYNIVEKEGKPKLKPKRRKNDTFIIPIPTRPQQICQVYVIGSNMFSQCGETEEEEAVSKLSIVSLEQFDIVDISAGLIHNAALTGDGKVVTWGCNDHGKQ